MRRVLALRGAIGTALLLVMTSAPAGALVLSLVPDTVVEEVGVPFDVDLTIAGLGDFGPDSLRAFTVKLAFDPTQLALLGVTPATALGDPACAPADPNPLCEATFTASESPAGLVTFVEHSLLEDLDVQPGSFVLGTFQFVGLDFPGVVNVGTIDLVVDFFTELVVEDGAGIPSLAPFSVPLPSADVTIVPEPATALLVVAGLLVLSARRARP